MNIKIRDILFFAIVVTLVFCNIPKPIQMNFIGGVFGSKLVFYPVILGFIYTAYWHYKYGNVLVKLPVIKKYVLVYTAVVLGSLILGLYNYPYFDIIKTGPLNQIEKLPKVLELFSEYGINLNPEIVIGFWMIARLIKGLVLEIFYTFGFAYMIYCWYKCDWYVAIKILGKGILYSLIVIIMYCLVEICYLSGNETAKSILENITPYIHSIKNNGTWWPPLLWKNQLRSVFAEPSYFGIYSAFCLPFLWLGIIKSKLNNKVAYLHVILTITMTFFLILTKARTGFMLHVGELLIFSLLLIYIRNTTLWKKSIVVFLCSTIAFVCGNLFISKYMNSKQIVDVPLKTSISSYIDSNAASLTNPDKRSNRARYSVMEADIKVGLEHPLLGVGSGLRTAYVIDAFSEKALQNTEVKMWLDFNKRLGTLKSGIPKLGEYTSRFCETGVLGLLAFLFPAFYLVKCMFCKLKKIEKEIQVYYVIFLISFAGILASGIGDTINITYCYWVLLGLGYAMCFGRGNDIEYKKRLLIEKYKVKNLFYTFKLSCYPKTTIWGCFITMVAINVICSYFMVKVVNGCVIYNVLFSLSTGVTASCVVAIVVELSNNYKSNRLACYELDSYYNLVIKFEGSKCVTNKVMNIDEEHEVHDIVQLVWKELPQIAPLLLTTFEHKKTFLTDDEIKILKSLKFEYDSIRDKVCSKISRMLQYDTVNHPDEDYLSNKYPNNIINNLPDWLKKQLATKEGKDAIQQLTDVIMADNFLLEQIMSDYDISIQSMNRHNNECEQDDIKGMQEEIEASEELTYDYTDMTEEEYKSWIDEINKDIEKEEIPFVSFCISKSCFEIAQHIEKLKKFVSTKPYVGVYLKIMASANKKE